jgi:two-component system sensor kinase FixL
VAILVGVAAVLLRELLRPWLGPGAPYLQFFPAIFAAAWYGGLGPGALTTGLGALAASYLYLAPAGFAIDGTHDAVSLALFSATGLAIAWVCDRMRIAERALRAEADLANNRAHRLDAIINTTVDGIIVINANGIVEEFNPGAERLFGYTAAEVIGHNVSMLMPSPHREEHDAYLARYRTTGRASVIGIGRDVSGMRRDGTMFPLHLSVGEFTIAGEHKFTGILHDLSARVRLEEQMREQTALAKLGEMAAVIAHEVKNPLAGIRGAIQVIAARMPKDATEAPVLAEIIKRIDSLDGMIKELLLFARTPQPRRIPTSLVPLVAATADLLTRDPSLQAVEVQIDGSAPPVPADAEMLKIVFQNLLINGAHAMKNRGRIRVEVNTSDSACHVTFSDEGPGIPVEVREKIFTPFFTTKSRGSGLGLPTAKRLVEAHNGQIVIDCPPAGGTSVMVRLPLES